MIAYRVIIGLECFIVNYIDEAWIQQDARKRRQVKTRTAVDAGRICLANQVRFIRLLGWSRLVRVAAPAAQSDQVE